MARTVFLASTCAVLGVTKALKVQTPSAGITVIADRTYTVEWEGTSANNRFELDLYYCGSFCAEDECGEWVTALCPYGEDGCPDNEGDYDVILPEPLMGTSGSGYKIRVVDIDDEEDADCSDEFYLLASDEAPEAGDVGGPYLEVTAPSEDDMAEACGEYTIEWDYDNGVGSKVDRFDIDLYKAEGSGDCGTYYTSICDKPSIGCKDSMGDYDVKIPCDAEPGAYKVRVSRFGDDSVYDCSDVFTIMPDDSGDQDDDGEDDEMSMFYRF